MKYYIIAGVGFSEMRTIALKLKDKLATLHGEDKVAAVPYGSLRRWCHSSANPSKGFKIPNEFSGLGFGKDAILLRSDSGLTTDQTEHLVMFGPGVTRNITKVIENFSRNDTSNPGTIQFSTNSTFTTWLFKTNENAPTMVNNIKQDWDTAEMINSGCPMENPCYQSTPTSLGFMGV